ncbi:MAG: WYL domain-containing protein [Gordonia sp. (in: high G+C Gram-positive bacteria)]
MGEPRKPKVERLLNLVICLLSADSFVTAEFIRTRVSPYNELDQSVEAFNRMFERDKNELRDLGIPVTTRSSKGGGVDGYRIDPDSYALPDITLDRDEAAAIATAAALWDSREISRLSQTAVLKLHAAGFDVRAENEAGMSAVRSARSLGSEETLAALLAASNDRRPVTFTYRSRPTVTGIGRTLEPWGVITYRGRWYVVGHDRDRDATRTFRLSRVSQVRAFGPRGTVTIPAGVDLSAVVADAVDSAFDDGGSASIWVAAGRAAGLRRLADHSEPHAFDGRPGDLLGIPVRSASVLARMVLGAGADAVVLSPPGVRDRVIAGLDTLAARDERADTMAEADR